MAENHENSKGSISDPDISAFQKYMNTPWDHEKGFMQIPRDTPKSYQTKNFLIFDITEVDAGIARTQALDVFGNHYMDFAESNIFTPLSQKGDPRHEEMRNEFRDFIDHMKSKIDIGMASLHGAGGGIADLDLDMAESDSSDVINLKAAREMADRRAIRRAIARTQGNISGAARILGISRPTLYDLIKQYELQG